MRHQARRHYTEGIFFLLFPYFFSRGRLHCIHFTLDVSAFSAVLKVSSRCRICVTIVSHGSNEDGHCLERLAVYI